MKVSVPMGNNAKENLYVYVDRVRENLGLSKYDTQVNTIEICAKRILGIDVLYHQFNTNGFCGFALVGDKRDTVVLNESRSPIERNFDCGHELIHLLKHRNEQTTFQCATKSQNSFLEWEANEGAAQLIVPYQDLIPRFVKLLDAGTKGIEGMLADYYHVTTQVIDIRIDNLAYEIDQYRYGVCIDHLELLSRRQLQTRGISPTQYRAQCAFALDWDSVIRA